MFRLLDHWRQRENDGLTPLIWNPSCELLNDSGLCSRSIGIAKKKAIPTPLDSGSSSSSDSPKPSDKDLEEEDFAAEMANIHDSDLGSHHSDQLSSPPYSGSRVSRVPTEREQFGGDIVGAPLSIPDQSSHSSKHISVS